MLPDGGKRGVQDALDFVSINGHLTLQFTSHGVVTVPPIVPRETVQLGPRQSVPLGFVFWKPDNRPFADLEATILTAVFPDAKLDVGVADRTLGYRELHVMCHR
jgi:hypothetical protein